MKSKNVLKRLNLFFFICICLQGHSLKAQFNFSSSQLQGASVANPTSLQFGPDNRLYVSQQDGTIKIFTIVRNAANNYQITSTETILLVKQIPNHFDDGSPKAYNINTNKRQITGLYVTGTSSNPIIYVNSSDNDIGAGSNGDKNLCTNSGIISKLTRNGASWNKIDLVRGLPRSEENHATNGLQLDEQENILYVTSAGLTNAGSPSKLFAYISEYALSACVLSVDLDVIEAMPLKADVTGSHPYKYDLPTLDDPTRTNNPDGTDIADPFGGNDGLNQAKIVIDGPVKIFASGFRNPYDLLIMKTPGKSRCIYAIDNGANQNWGGHPDKEGTVDVTNNYVIGEPGSNSAGPNDPVVNNLDGLHFIGNLDNYIVGSYYGGHPNPTRANPSGAGLYTHQGTLDAGTGVWRTSKTDPNFPLPSDWPPLPVSLANSIEGNFQNPGETNSALLTFDNSTNGLCEYTASTFNGNLKGNIFTVSFDGSIFRIKLNQNGNDVLNTKGNKKINQDAPFASGFGSKPLDITSQGDNQIFPGTIWTAVYADNFIVVFEPQEIACTGNYNNTDEDGDFYLNSDEIDNNTNPCSAASKPDDNDNDFISDLKDTDDDNDGVSDLTDRFQIDASNGLNTTIPFSYSLFNNNPGTGFFGLGFTGLMNNGTDYLNLYNENNLIAGGAIGAFTINAVPPGDASGSNNNQNYGFQFGVKVNTQTAPFTIKTKMLGSFFNNQTPSNFQSQGFFIGTGDQNNYLKIVLNANNGNGGIEVVYENSGTTISNQYNIPFMPSTSVDLFLSIDPATGKVQPKYSLDGGNIISLNFPVTLSGALLNTLQGSSALAVGIISTSRNSTPFNATWDFIEATFDNQNSKGNWSTIIASDGSTPTHRHENAYVQAGEKFYLIGGRGGKPVQVYDPKNKTWKNAASPPVNIHHFQALEFKGMIYAAGAFTGDYPNETPLPNIYIYDPVSNQWFTGPEIPQNRRRGSCGAVVYNDKIYLIGGITNGHNSGYVAWFDEFDPETNLWKTLPDAPHLRDHFHAAIINNKIYLAGGRRTSLSTGHLFDQTVAEVDVYNFTSGQWSSLANTIPTKRAGATVGVLGNELLVMGGESMAHLNAHNETEALDINTENWRTLDTLDTGRHGTQAIVSNGGIYIAAGNGSRGGGAELNSQEAFYLGQETIPTGIPIVKSNLDAPQNIIFGTVAPGTSKTESITLTNTGGNQGIIITSYSIPNNTANVFSFSHAYTLPIIIYPGKSINLNVKYQPVSSTPSSANLIIAHSSGSTTIKLNNGGSQTTLTPVFLINAGGDEIASSPMKWNSDTQTNPSQYSNYTQTSGKTSAFTGTNNTDAPTQIFSSYRLDGGVPGDALSKEMRWTFPVPNGEYEIALYFSETWSGGNSPGKRVFDVLIENQLSLNDYDIFADAGFNNAVKKTFRITVIDSNVNIDLLHVVENPRINGIGIYSVNSSAPPEESATGISVKITEPLNGTHFAAPANISIKAEVNSTMGSGTYLKINCPDAAWRKLKLGYNATSLYSTKINVTSSGNNAVEITLKDFGNANWNKIQIRPQGNSASPVVLGDYIASSEELTDGWKKLKIPLSAFPSGIDFTQLSLIEIPYSAAAGQFNVGIREIKFTGGSTPFTWFGGNKTNNIHDGTGGAGQLTASLIMNASNPNVNKVEFYQGKIKIGEDNSIPYQFSWNSVNAGIYYIKAKAILNDNSIATSDSIKITVEETASSGQMKITIIFDETPQAFSIDKAALKYNKDFAFSFTFDDGKEDAYTNAFPLFNGGFVSGNGKNYPGLYYTDGCGNSIPFRAGLAWNSVNNSGFDTHNNSPGYMTWQQFSFLYNQKWNVFNHSYSHAAGTGTDYNFQISKNNDYIKNKTGLALSHFVIPSGDTSYTIPAFNYGMKAVYNQSGNFPGANGGLKIDSPLSLQKFKLNRHFIYDSKYDTTNIKTEIDKVAAKSINGNHYWFNDFTHSVSFTQNGGSLVFPTFEYYMKHIEKTYGKNGSDRVWMAPLQEVYEYLAVRENILFTSHLSGNRLDIVFNIDSVQSDLNKNALTLIINSGINFSAVETEGITNYSFKGSGNKKIINLEWGNIETGISARQGINTQEILYRINAGGSTIGANDISETWIGDNAENPSIYYVSGVNNKINYTTDSISLVPSLPPGIPKGIFQSERTTGNTTDSLQWEFPVAEGGEVEVRLYFSEIYFNASEERVFNIEIEDSLKLSNYDIYKEVGKNTGTMKTFTATSDGNININLIRIKQQPKISGIEIICLNDKCNKNNLKFAENIKSPDKTIKAYPNPFYDGIKLNVDSTNSAQVRLDLYNNVGEHLQTMEYVLKSGYSELEINLSDLPVGIYFLKISDKNKTQQTIKLIKQ